PHSCSPLSLHDALPILLLSRWLRPIIQRLLPEYQKNTEAIQAVCMNLTANLLGLGNAATPMGIAAMKAMAKTSPLRASNSMVRLDRKSTRLNSSHVSIS